MIRPLLIAVTAALGLLAAPAAGQTVDFAGHSWLVRTYDGGPGPNRWSARNVRVTEDGLHLTIQQVDGVWQSAEVVMLDGALGFGTYEFDVAGDLNALDPNAVLGLFNYPGSPDVGPDGTNEIDIEFSPWGDTHNPNRLNWNVYPAREDGERGHFAMPLPAGIARSTHRFTWAPDEIRYESRAGETPIGDWTYRPANSRRDIPQQPLVLHINLWLLEGRAPLSGVPVEIVIRDFRFTPQ